jgi:NAD(P)-dependent dehydrogenase (short-subunit alcohol dehydrogenase family)
VTHTVIADKQPNLLLKHKKVYRMTIVDVSSRTVSQLFSLRERVAVVTGGARGIGFAIANRLAEVGAHVAIADLDNVAAAQAAARIGGAHGHPCIGLQVDVANARSVSRLVDRVVEELGHLRIWVNNAGIYPITPLLELTEEEWDRVIDVNLKGTFLGAREAAKRMIAAGTPGVIINIASTAGYKVHAFGCAHYASSKNGVRALTKALAAELGPFGIRTLAIAPMTTDTPGIQELRKSPALKDVMKHADARPKPLGRDAVPDDIARVALFCASDLSLIMTGSTLLAEGGELAVM